MSMGSLAMLASANLLPSQQLSPELRDYLAEKFLRDLIDSSMRELGQFSLVLTLEERVTIVEDAICSACSAYSALPESRAILTPSNFALLTHMVAIRVAINRIS